MNLAIERKLTSS